MRVELTLMSDGYCTQRENIACSGGRFQRIRFASMFALIKHPKFGLILFDTGYTQRFLEETKTFPAKFYRWVTPITFNAQGSAEEQLKSHGIPPGMVQQVIISHFHADHIGGLKDFPNARFYCSRTAFDSVKNLSGFKAVKHAFLSGLMPKDFETRVTFTETKPLVKLPARYAPFTHGYDLFGDGSILAVDLPGHATGQLGIFLTNTNGREHLLATDACWLSRQYRENLMPHAIVRLLVDWSAYKKTLQKLHELHRNNPDLKIVPAHCEEIWKG